MNASIIPAGQPGQPPNSLAPILADTVRELADTRGEALADRLVRALLMNYSAWLQRELCRARDWTPADLERAWKAECERRDRQTVERRTGGRG